MLSTKAGDKVNGCITNTCMQVANSPTRIAIACINTNYTCDLIKESGVFALSLLSEDCGYELIQHFGMQSGRDVDKFANLQLPVDVNGIPYLAWQTCAVISGYRHQDEEELMEAADFHIRSYEELLLQ